MNENSLPAGDSHKTRNTNPILNHHRRMLVARRTYTPTCDFRETKTQLFISVGPINPVDCINTFRGLDWMKRPGSRCYDAKIAAKEFGTGTNDTCFYWAYKEPDHLL
ncbi:hypothetical protein AMATHDRAFT_70226 [Amanita thiersii Skay4041]|uniref:Uncharacterized protein n=1 Tax=Amanita thiersii Skay4041 TaxID=703135 RepID=A0A2A9N8S9_9AGAR|nr:hypothetical protein AMATHDRAFT_70226 [Amanita thiersii Skay4041]